MVGRVNLLGNAGNVGNVGKMSKSEGWEGGEEGFAALRLPFGLPFGREHFVVAALCAPHTALSSDSCFKTSSSASRFKERGCGAKIVESVWLREGNNTQ